MIDKTELMTTANGQHDITDSAMLTPQPSAYNSNLPCSAAMKVHITTHTYNMPQTAHACTPHFLHPACHVL